MANYVDDFESDPIAVGVPTGWSNRWNNPTPNWEVASDSLGGRSLRYLNSATARCLVSLDAVNSDANRANCEVLVVVASAQITGSLTHIGAAGRASGIASAETAYVATLFGSELRLLKYVSGTFTELAITTGFGAVVNTFYRIRLRCNGTSIQAKAWLNSAGEPGSWTLSATDSAISAAGWCGYFAFSSSSAPCAQIAVGTNGDTATFSAGPTIYRPSSDLSVAGWTFSGAASVAAAIGETAASDAEFATSPNLADPATVAISPSLPAGTWAVKLRPRRNLAGVGQVRVRLLNSSNVDVGGSDWITPTTSFSLFEVGFTTTGLADRLRIEVQ